jgi:hypothetical protein
VAYCEIAYEKRWIKGTNRYSWTLRRTYDPKVKANANEDCSENQFTSHNLSNESHERRVEIRVQALVASIDNTLLGKVRPSDICGVAIK